MAYPIGKLTIRPLCMLWLRKAEGLDNIPKDKPFIIAANHSSYYETLLVPSVVISRANKKIHALVNSYYWGNFLTKYFLDLWESVPVFVEKNTKSKEKNKLAFEKAVKYLKDNELVMIFPEGKRSVDGKLNKGYNGIARITLATKFPVLPMGVIDANKVLPIGAMFPRFRRCEVKIGKLMYFDKYKKTDKKTLEEITRQIMKEIANLIGQEYGY